MCKKQLSNSELRLKCIELISKIDEINELSSFVKNMECVKVMNLENPGSAFQIAANTKNGDESIIIRYTESNYNLLRAMIDNDVISLAEQVHSLREQIGIK